MLKRFHSHNQIKLLHNGAEYFPALESAIDAAKNEIHLETYIFENDIVGNRLAEALKRAAQRGVATHLLLDGFGSRLLEQGMIKAMREAGVKVLFYGQRFSPFTIKRYHLRRMHRKLAVIDARIALVGGINIVDDLNPSDYLQPRFDYAVQVEGPLLAAIHAAVKSLWRRVSWIQFKQKMVYPKLQPVVEPKGKALAALVVRDNFRHRRDIEQIYLRQIEAAQQEIIIANAYFLPGIAFRRALVRAAKRGVRVVLLLQGQVEYFFQHYATRALYRQLIEAGIEIFEYRQGLMHAKVAVIDKIWSTVGSSNIDPFSLLLAKEANVVVKDHEFARILHQSLLQAIEGGAERIIIDHWKRDPFLFKALPSFCYGAVRLMMGLAGYATHDY